MRIRRRGSQAVDAGVAIRLADEPGLTVGHFPVLGTELELRDALVLLGGRKRETFVVSRDLLDEDHAAGSRRHAAGEVPDRDPGGTPRGPLRRGVALRVLVAATGRTVRRGGRGEPAAGHLGLQCAAGVVVNRERYACGVAVASATATGPSHAATTHKRLANLDPARQVGAAVRRLPSMIVQASRNPSRLGIVRRLSRQARRGAILSGVDREINPLDDDPPRASPAASWPRRGQHIRAQRTRRASAVSRGCRRARAGRGRCSTACARRSGRRGRAAR